LGREGVSESMKDMALKAIEGRDFGISYVDIQTIKEIFYNNGGNQL